MYLGVSNFQRAISIVIPRSRSAFSLSRTQARIKWEHQPSVLRVDINPRLTIFERAFPELGGLLLEFFDGTLVNSTAFVDQMASSRRLARVDVADN